MGTAGGDERRSGYGARRSADATSSGVCRAVLPRSVAAQRCPWRRDGVAAPGEEADDDGRGCGAPTDAALHATLSRLDSNCFGLDASPDGGGPVVGHGCYLAAATFNHSCAPNCAVSSGVERMVVTTLTAVEAGDELCIPYMHSNMPVGARRKLLRAAYNFECACARCMAEAAAGAPKAKLSYHERASSGKAKGGKAGGHAPMPEAPKPKPKPKGSKSLFDD